MDINTSTLGNLVDISAYSNASSVFPQTIATVNTSGGGVYYALLVYARSGFSSTDTFEVNMSLGLGGDVVESNDNAFTAYPLGTITVNGALAQGVNLDSPLDVDWYQISIANNNDFNRISISNGLSSSVNYDLFYASSGTTMVKVAPANGYYPVNSGGTYYLRVTDNGNNFNTGNVAYAIDFSAILTPSRVSSSFRVVGMGSDTNYIPSQTYRVYSGSNYWGETRYALPSSCRLEWTSTLYSASGYLCKDASNLAHIRVTNDSWVPVEFRSASAVSPARQNGTTTCVLTKSVGCVGTYGDRDYDTDCTLSMWIEGYDSITNGEMPIFVTFKIWP